MKIYLVGGAVRDKLLGLPIKERDFVIVGATPEELLAQGYKQVGKDFPVFLHPKTHEEYALARTERKTGKGYTQFKCHADPSVTLEDDLKRRDLTINAMAISANNRLIDPYGGAIDLQKKILRHVSAAFAEDPVRILRVARFAAKLPKFKVHPATYKLMQAMLDAGEVDALIPERVWQEFSRALKEPQPSRFLEVLNKCYVLKKLFPEIAAQLPAVQITLTQATALSENSEVRFAAMLQSLEADNIKNLCKRFNIPKNYRDLALLVSNNFIKFSKSLNLNAEQLLEILEATDAFRKPARFKNFLLTCKACDGSKESSKKFQYLAKILEHTKDIKARDIIKPNTVPEKVKQLLKTAHIKAIQNIQP